METVKRQTESYLFENSGEIFRGIPFYELSIEEWVVYQQGQTDLIDTDVLLDEDKLHRV